MFLLSLLVLASWLGLFLLSLLMLASWLVGQLYIFALLLIL